MRVGTVCSGSGGNRQLVLFYMRASMCINRDDENFLISAKTWQIVLSHFEVLDLAFVRPGAYQHQHHASQPYTFEKEDNVTNKVTCIMSDIKAISM